MLIYSKTCFFSEVVFTDLLGHENPPTMEMSSLATPFYWFHCGYKILAEIYSDFLTFLSWCRFQPWCSEYFLLNLLHPLEPFRKILVFHFVWTHNTSKVQNCKIIVICFFQTWLHLSSCVFSIALFFIVALIYNISCPICYPPSNPYWTMEKLMGEPVFYLTCLISPIVALLPR